MDKIKFQCPGCGKAVSAPATMAGKSGKCPSCGRMITIPVPVPAATAQRAAPPPVLPPQLKATLDSLRSGTIGAQLVALDEIPPDLSQEYIPAVQGAIVDAMNGGDGRVLFWGAVVLARLGDESDLSVNTLLARLSSPRNDNENVAWHAIQGLSYVRGRIDVVDKLVKVAESDKNLSLRQRACFALAAMGNDVAKLFLDHQACNDNKAASFALTQLERLGPQSLRAAIVDGHSTELGPASEHGSHTAADGDSTVEVERSSGSGATQVCDGLEDDPRTLTEMERELLASFRRHAREYAALEQAERKRHAAVEQAKCKEASDICADAARQFQSVSYPEETVRGSFLVRGGLVSSLTSVDSGPVHGTTGAEFSRAMNDCARVTQEKAKAIQSLSTSIKAICGCAAVLFFVMLCAGAGFAGSFWVSLVVAVVGSGLTVSAGSSMCRALYRAIRTAERIRDRWCEGAHAYCDAEIAKSSEQSRAVLARQLEVWRDFLSLLQNEERAAARKGDECAPPWDNAVWTHWKPSERKPSHIRIGNYFLRTTLPTGDDASVIVPAIVAFPGDRCLLLKAGNNVVAKNQNSSEQGNTGKRKPLADMTEEEKDEWARRVRNKRRERARRWEDLDDDDEVLEELL